MSIFLYNFLAILGVSALTLLWFFYKKFLHNSSPSIDPSGKAVFVTGCDSGIGFQAALLFDKLGLRVFAGCLSPDGDGAKRLKSKASDKLQTVGLDITSEDSVKNAFETIKEKLGPNEDLWAIVNNAGICILGFFDWYAWKHIQSMIEVNLIGQIRVLRKFLPLIKKSKGRLVTISSISTRIPFPGSAVYTATKYALEGLHDTLRIELQDSGVKVVIIQPGDHSRDTNILNEHQRMRDEQWTQMSPEQRASDGPAFNCFHESVRQGIKILNPVEWCFRPILGHLKEAVLSPNPQPKILSGNRQEITFVGILKLFPISLRDNIIATFVRKAWKLGIKH